MSNMPKVQSLSALASKNRMEMESTKERLNCLLRQEQKHYMCTDYVTEGDEDYKCDTPPSSNIVEECVRVVTDLAFSSSTPATPAGEKMQTVVSSACVKDLADSQEASTAKTSSSSSSFVRDGKSINSNLVGNWRKQMLEWSNLVVDSFGMHREVVAVAFNILDRYVAHECKSAIPITRDDYQLFCMTSVFMAVKMLESYPRKLTAAALVDMSRGFYACDDILYTEREILRTLSWFVNPTTPVSYCRIYWELFPVPVSFEFKAACQLLSEVALAETFFLRQRPSLVGLAAVLHAARIESVQTSVTEEFLSELQGTVAIHNNRELDAIYQRLELLSSR